MKALADYVHSKGLKIGIYSSPGPAHLPGAAGSYEHEAIDAKTWAAWGFDLLKHDWCSYERIAKDKSLAELQKPYIVMRDALRASRPRHRLQPVPVRHGQRVGVGSRGRRPSTGARAATSPTCGRTCRLSASGRRAARSGRGPGTGHGSRHAGIGKVGWGPSIHDTRLTPNEQITHITLWALQAAPLLIGADMTQFDAFTTALMTNHEVLEVNQDILARGASRIWQRERLELWARPLADGTIAVGLFNRGLQAAKVSATWKDLGITGAQPVRDLWLHKDLGSFTGEFASVVPAHGAVMVKNRSDPYH